MEMSYNCKNSGQGLKKTSQEVVKVLHTYIDHKSSLSNQKKISLFDINLGHSPWQEEGT